MRQIWLVAKREFLVEVRKKSFMILTIAMPFLVVGLMSLVVFLNLANDETNNIAVVDNSGLFSHTFSSDKQEYFTYYKAEDLASLKDSIVHSKDLQGVLYIPKTDSSLSELKNGIEFIVNKNVGISMIPGIEHRIEAEIERINLRKKGITAQDLKEAKMPIEINVTQQNEGGSTRTNQMTEGVKSTLSGVLMYVTFMFIMIYGVRIMRNVIEEKNNRVVEIIISSIKPFNLMMGKILGTTMVALTQFGVWIITIILLLSFFPAIAGMFTHQSEMVAMSAPAQSNTFLLDAKEIIAIIFNMNLPLIISVFFIYFFFGYLLYSSVFAAIGASVESDSETQQFMWIGIMPLMLGLYGSISIFENPDGPVGFWFSMLPLTSPVTMMARITYGVPSWQLALSILLLIGTMLLMVWLAAKIYRVGILMYGKKASLKEWIKWVKY